MSVVRRILRRLCPRDVHGAVKVEEAALRMLRSLRKARDRYPEDAVIEREYRKVEEIVTRSAGNPR